MCYNCTPGMFRIFFSGQRASTFFHLKSTTEPTQTIDGFSQSVKRVKYLLKVNYVVFNTGWRIQGTIGNEGSEAKTTRFSTIS